MHSKPSAFAFLFLVAIAPLWAAANPPAAATTAKADLDRIVTGVEQAQQESSDRARPYTMVRDYRLYQGDPQRDAKTPNSEVRAQVNYLPPGEKTFNIVRSTGMGRGTGVVQRVLENEAQMAKNPDLSEVSRRNYSFSFQGERTLDGRQCYVLGLQPLRKETYLLKGSVLVDGETYRILQIEGEPSRSPSWWLKSMHLAMTYSNLEGVWLPVSTDAVADVRLFGTHTMTSRAVSFAAGESVAMNAALAAKADALPRSLTGASNYSSFSQPATAPTSRPATHPVTVGATLPATLPAAFPANRRSRRVRPNAAMVGAGILPQ